MKQSDSPKPFGYIYRIFHESMMHRDSDGNYYQPCYVGRTEESIHKRFLGHKRDARSVRGSTSGGDGKLHSKMWAENCIGFKVEELAIAYSPQELAKLEAHYIKHHDSIRKGWNKITASQTTRSRGESVLIVIDGKKMKFESSTATPSSRISLRCPFFLFPFVPFLLPAMTHPLFKSFCPSLCATFSGGVLPVIRETAWCP
jgi:hypothetical protein